MSDTDPPTVTVQNFLVEQPLYAEVAADKAFMHAIRAENFQFDGYCIWCNLQTIFKTARNTGGAAADPTWYMRAGAFDLQVFCQRDGHHIYRFYAFRTAKGVKKIGQLPSLEDISGADLARFRPVLSAESFRELRRATGLASHGIGIGSFVYLRRIMERMLAEHYEAAKSNGTAPADFETKRVVEKIKSLEGVLPPALVKNRAAYGILSKGLHELTEEACLAFFPALRSAIILILEEDLERKLRTQREQEIERDIAKYAAALGAPGEPAPPVGPPADGDKN